MGCSIYDQIIMILAIACFAAFAICLWACAIYLVGSLLNEMRGR